MNSLFENRNAWLDAKSTTKPLHMVCPSCTGYWGKGYLVHLDTCQTPNWHYDSKVDKCEGHHTCQA